MDNENICILCKAEFKDGALDANNKCEQCEKLWPGIVNKDDLKKDPEKEKNEGRLKNVIAKQIEEVLMSYGILDTCECGEKFFKRSPASKKCSACKGDN